MTNFDANKKSNKKKRLQNSLGSIKEVLTIQTVCAGETKKAQKGNIYYRDKKSDNKKNNNSSACILFLTKSKLKEKGHPQMTLSNTYLLYR